MKRNALLLSLLMASLALAGCTGDDASVDDTGAVEGKVDETQVELQAGKGAISGLLVDDRFRPLQLTDDPTTEFQTTGFILLQETGQQVKTSENGEFTFLDLEPGSYTLRITAGGHEATPTKVNVEEGLFAEATVIARRVVSTGSFIVTEEYSFFAPCAAAAVATSAIFGCFDASGDNWRPGPGLNYTGLDNVTYAVFEYKTDEPGNFLLQVRQGSSVFCNIETQGSNYGRAIMVASNETIYDEMQCPNPWPNDGNFEAIAFYDGQVENPFVGTPVQDIPTAGGVLDNSGIGATTSVSAQIIISVFIHDPEVDLEAYQILDPEAE